MFKVVISDKEGKKLLELKTEERRLVKPVNDLAIANGLKVVSTESYPAEGKPVTFKQRK